ncbi:hypothetical protein V1477_019323 [Vespula maculifrons]|uniref:Uncharacterized protein n=1 Tax=Vespula maculifrons TaxID=7453 RepID=A0ABD2AT06_VESMC
MDIDSNKLNAVKSNIETFKSNFEESVGAYKLSADDVILPMDNESITKTYLRYSNALLQARRAPRAVSAHARTLLHSVAAPACLRVVARSDIPSARRLSSQYSLKNQEADGDGDGGDGGGGGSGGSGSGGGGGGGDGGGGRVGRGARASQGLISSLTRPYRMTAGCPIVSKHGKCRLATEINSLD